MRLYKISDLRKDPQRGPDESAAVVTLPGPPGYQESASSGPQIMPQGAPGQPRHGHSPFPRLAPMR